MDKLANWRSRLDECVNEYESATFKYGKYDCSTFVADCIVAQTGIDIFSEFRGKYKTLHGGYKLCRKLGYKDNVDIFEKQLTPIPSAFASTGDVGVVKATDQDEAVCIIAGRFALGVTQVGLIRFDVSLITKTFKI